MRLSFSRKPIPTSLTGRTETKSRVSDPTFDEGFREADTATDEGGLRLMLASCLTTARMAMSDGVYFPATMHSKILYSPEVFLCYFNPFLLFKAFIFSQFVCRLYLNQFILCPCTRFCGKFHITIVPGTCETSSYLHYIRIFRKIPAAYFFFLFRNKGTKPTEGFL